MDAANHFPALMIDIETLSTHSSRALILSVGVLPFTLEKAAPRFGPALTFLPDIEPQLASGRIVDPSTQAWWSQQSAVARLHWADPSYKGRPDAPIARVSAGGLATWFDANLPNDCDVWANGVAFDVSNIENLFHEAGRRPPWRYDRVRDFRTIVKLLPKLRQRPDETTSSAAHDPVYDCRQQVWTLWEHLPEPLFPAPNAALTAIP